MNAKAMSQKRYACMIAAVLALSACSQKTAQEKGAEMAGKELDTLAGVGDALQKKGGAAGESFSAGIGTMTKGMERGLLKSGREIVTDPSVRAAGISVTTVQDADAEKAAVHGLDAYIIAKAPAAGTLRMFVYDALGNEIGRSSVSIELDAEAAKYQTFALDSQVDLKSVNKVSFAFNASKKPPSA